MLFIFTLRRSGLDATVSTKRTIHWIIVNVRVVRFAFLYFRVRQLQAHVESYLRQPQRLGIKVICVVA